MSTIVDSRMRGIPMDCPQCGAQLDFLQPQSYIGSLRVRCFSCQSLLPYNPTTTSGSKYSKPSATSSSGAGSGAGAQVKRGLGTDANPIDTAYYDVLEVGTQATGLEIKKAYRRLAIKLHPDKNRDDPDAEEKFKQIAIAYQILSDPSLRSKYNMLGQKNGGGGVEPSGGFSDPEEVFGSLFGGERFHDLIGTISIGRDMKEALQADREEEAFQENNAQPVQIGPNGKRIVPPEEVARKAELARVKAEGKAKARKERVDKLVENLGNKLSIYTESAGGAGGDRVVVESFKEICRLEAMELVKESYGHELLQAIGKTYIQKSEHHVASSQFAPLGWFHGAKQNYNLVADTVSTLRAALDLKAVFEKLQLAEKSGLSPEAIHKLEEQAAEQGMRTIWKGAKLEVESVIREVCEKVLSDPSVSAEKRHLRAVALAMMGEAFISIPKEGEMPPPIPSLGSRPPPSVPPRPQGRPASTAGMPGYNVN